MILYGNYENKLLFYIEKLRVVWYIISVMALLWGRLFPAGTTPISSGSCKMSTHLSNDDLQNVNLFIKWWLQIFQLISQLMSKKMTIYWSNNDLQMSTHLSHDVSQNVKQFITWLQTKCQPIFNMITNKMPIHLSNLKSFNFPLRRNTLLRTKLSVSKIWNFANHSAVALLYETTFYRIDAV